MNLSYDLLYAVLYIGIACAVVSLVLTVILFFLFKIPAVISMLNGSAAKKAIEKISANPEHAKSPVKHEKNRPVYKTEKMEKNSKKLETASEQTSVLPDYTQALTSDLSQTQVLPNDGLNETVVLQAEPSTGADHGKISFELKHKNVVVGSEEIIGWR